MSPDQFPEHTAQPFVSVVMPVYNEQEHIQESLRSVLEQDYPQDRYEVVIADGGSVDATREIIERVAVGRNVRVIANPQRTQASGLNLAIASSQGKFIVRQDGHSVWTHHHVSRAVALLEETGADNVGGQMDAEGITAMGRAIACALHSPFGVGGAKFHYSTQQEVVPTVFLGAFRRSVFEQIGLFNEAYPPHEDYELNKRIRAAGGRIIYSPEIPTRYYVRESLTKVTQQYFKYGRAKARVAKHVNGVIRPYQLIAPVCTVLAPFVLYGFTLPRWRPLAIVASVSYVIAAISAGLLCSHKQPRSVRWRVPLVFPLLHGAWGTGFWFGLIGKIHPSVPEKLEQAGGQSPRMSDRVSERPGS